MGLGGGDGYCYSANCYNGGDSHLDNILAYGGGAGGDSMDGSNGASGGGGSPYGQGGTFNTQHLYVACLQRVFSNTIHSFFIHLSSCALTRWKWRSWAGK